MGDEELLVNLGRRTSLNGDAEHMHSHFRFQRFIDVPNDDVSVTKVGKWLRLDRNGLDSK
jgi:hypothetical protein